MDTPGPIEKFVTKTQERDRQIDEENRALIAKAHTEMRYRPVAVAVIVNKDGRVLLVSSAMNLSNWGFPQGGIEIDEDPRAALLREIHEELGITRAQVTIRRFLGKTYFDAPIARQGERGFSNGKFYFLYEVFYDGPDQLEIDTREIGLYAWVNSVDADCLTETSHGPKRELVCSVVHTVTTMHRLTRILETKNST